MNFDQLKTLVSPSFIFKAGPSLTYKIHVKNLIIALIDPIAGSYKTRKSQDRACYASGPRVPKSRAHTRTTQFRVLEFAALLPLILRKK